MLAYGIAPFMEVMRGERNRSDDAANVVAKAGYQLLKLIYSIFRPVHHGALLRLNGLAGCRELNGVKRDRSVRNHENNQFEYRSRNVLHHIWVKVVARGGDAAVH
jgi:hypothetical protein